MSVTEYLEGDHARLDGILAEVGLLVAASSFQEAGYRFTEFTRGLGRHIDLEEQILFPFFEKVTGMSGGGPTSVMRSEHVEIRRRMNAVTTALASAAPSSSIAVSIQALTELLAAHNMKEERVLYPMTDQALGNDRARDDLVQRLRAF